MKMNQIIFIMRYEQIKIPIFEGIKTQLYFVDSMREGKFLMEDPDCILYETLIVTDYGEIAQFFSENGYPVIGCLHDKNRDEHFDLEYLICNCEDVEEAYYEKVFYRAYGVPLVVMETKRCIIREMSVDDLDDLYRLYEDKRMTRYMEDLFSNREEELEYIKNYVKRIYGYYGYGIWLVVKKDTMEIIGRAGVEYKEGVDGLELGYMIAPKYQKCGYATEVCQEILNYVSRELEIEKVVAFMDKHNIPSIALCRKLGFEEEEEFQLMDEKQSLQKKYLTIVNKSI